jgi:hypothetical protein
MERRRVEREKGRHFDVAQRYGNFTDKAILDGRVRTITYTSNDTSVTAIVPHFWDSACMFSSPPSLSLISEP